VLADEHDVVYVGVVGDDVAGEMFIRDLEESGVGANLEMEHGPTGVVVAVVAPDGQRAMMTDRGVNSLLSRDMIVEALEEPFDHLHVSGYSFLDDATRGAATAALDLARQMGATTSVDVCSLAPLLLLGVSTFADAIGHVTMLFANEEEAFALSGVNDIDGATRFLRSMADEVVVTRGDLGAVVARAGESLSRPSARVDVVDTTGAGDAATGAYLSARLDGLECGAALDQAMRRASSVVGGLGSRG
jgi:sugar/nucleoside kinase (ribokinase family)